MSKSIRSQVISQLQGWSEKQQEIERLNRNIRTLVRVQQEREWSRSTHYNQPTEKDREQLLTQLDGLREGVALVRSTWELAKGKAEAPTPGDGYAVRRAERLLEDGNKAATSGSREGFDSKYWLEHVTTEAEETNAAIDRGLATMIRKSQERAKRQTPQWWARSSGLGESFKEEKLRQRINRLRSQAEKLSGSSQLAYHPLFDEDESDTLPPDAAPVDDPSAKLIIQKDRPSDEIRFECNELQKELKTTGESLGDLSKVQRLEPVQVTAVRDVEWWWFEDRFYRVEFEEGQPSAALAIAISLEDEFNQKESLDGTQKVGYSPDELVERVFEARGKVENDFERALRADKLAAILDQWESIALEDSELDRQVPSRGEKLQPDPSAKITTRRGDTSKQVFFESSIHRPPFVLPINDEQLDLASKLQNYHPLLVTKLAGRGKSKGSEAVAEWWWFRGDFYVAKRRRGYKSNVLAAIARQQTSIRDRKSLNFTSYLPRSWSAWASARIPKLAVGEVAEDVYEDGFAPEEIARLVYASQGRRENREDKFDRVEAAKDLLSRTPVCDELWEEGGDGFHRKWYEQYLEARIQGYKGGYQQWRLENTGSLTRRMEASSPRVNKIIDEEDKKQEERSRTLESVTSRDRELDKANYMEGGEFERFIDDILSRSGYKVESTRSSGDQGVDILLDMEGRKIAVQLKRYTRPVGNKAIQEVLAGRIHYAAQEAWVITTSSFTRSALELAQSTGVRLIDGNELREWLIELNNQQE